MKQDPSNPSSELPGARGPTSDRAKLYNVSYARQHEQTESVEQHQSSQPAGQEFGSVEEMLRYDAAQTETPLSLAVRLKNSLAQEAKSARVWWRRLFAK